MSKLQSQAQLTCAASIETNDKKSARTANVREWPGGDENGILVRLHAERPQTVLIPTRADTPEIVFNAAFL
jgi:hypothetical protein